MTEAGEPAAEAPAQQEEAGSADAPAEAGTGFQDLDDEALGLIWSKLAGDRQARNSLRQASRAVAVSQSVNAQIQRMVLELRPGQEALAVTDQLLCFPRTASLRELEIKQEGRGNRSMISMADFLAALNSSAPAQAQVSGLTALHAWVPIRGCWEELSSTLTALCPSLQQLTAKGVSGFSAGPLQGLSCLHTLEISFLVVEQSLQSALNSLGSLVTLTRLSVSFGTLAEVSQVVSIAALGKLQRLQHLSLVLPGTTLQGVSGVATGCAQLTQLNLSVRAVEAGEGEEEQQQGGADAQDGISGNGDIGGGSCSASGSGAPWWPSLQQVDLGLMDHEGECQPGHLTALHLDRARHLTQLGPWVFGCIKLNHLCSASSPGALRQLCEQLSQVSQGVRPDSLSLIDRRPRGPDREPLSAHLSALAPFAHHLKSFSLLCCAGSAVDAAAAGALASSLPSLQQLELSSVAGTPLPGPSLMQLAVGLPELRRLVLKVTLASASDVAAAALAAQQQVQFGVRSQSLVIELYGGEEVVAGGAEAVHALLAQEGAELRHVTVQ